LPHEILKSNGADICFNQIVTGIGFEEDYRNQIIATLKSYEVKPSGNENIKQLEKLLKQTMERKNGRK
jgi:hypothetical protein